MQYIKGTEIIMDGDKRKGSHRKVVAFAQVCMFTQKTIDALITSENYGYAKTFSM